MAASYDLKLNRSSLKTHRPNDIHVRASDHLQKVVVYKMCRAVHWDAVYLTTRPVN